MPAVPEAYTTNGTCYMTCGAYEEWRKTNSAEEQARTSHCLPHLDDAHNDEKQMLDLLAQKPVPPEAQKFNQQRTFHIGVFMNCLKEGRGTADPRKQCLNGDFNVDGIPLHVSLHPTRSGYDGTPLTSTETRPKWTHYEKIWGAQSGTSITISRLLDSKGREHKFVPPRQIDLKMGDCEGEQQQGDIGAGRSY